MTSRNDPGMETPVSPITLEDETPKTAAPARGRRAKRGANKPAKRGGPAGGGAERGPLGTGFAYISGSWRALLLILVVQLLLGLTVVLPFWSAISEGLDHHPHATSLAGAPTPYERTFAQWEEGGLDSGIWRDIKRQAKPLFGNLGIIHFWIAIVAWFFGALAAGGFLGTAVSGENPVRMGSFLAHGGRLYGPMLRVGLCFGVAYYLVARLVLEGWSGVAASTEFMDASEASGFWGDRLREAVVVLCFFWFRIAADLARARLAVHGTRGAVGAFFRGLGSALRPKCMLIALAIGLPAYVLLIGLGFGAMWLTGDGTWTLVALFVLMQVAVLIRWAGRGAVLAAYTKVV